MDIMSLVMGAVLIFGALVAYDKYKEDKKEKEQPKDGAEELSEDAAAYLKRYPDVAKVPAYNSNAGARKHYESYGKKEGRIWGEVEEADNPPLTGDLMYWKAVADTRGGCPVAVFNRGDRYEDNSMYIMDQGRKIKPTEFIPADKNDNGRDLVFFQNIRCSDLIAPVLYWNGNDGYAIKVPCRNVGA